MVKKRHKQKLDEPFVAIYRSVLDSPSFYQMSAYAKALLYDLMGQYKGDNNGNLTVAFSALKDKGWRSKTTLWRSEKELINLKFIHRTRKGHFPSTCSLYALTWFKLDESKKFDPEAMATFEYKGYKHKPLVIKPKPLTRNQILKGVLGETRPLVHH